jgi:hypothetical protein
MGAPPSTAWPLRLPHARRDETLVVGEVSQEKLALISLMNLPERSGSMVMTR